jgi:hypothetical protein
VFVAPLPAPWPDDRYELTALFENASTTYRAGSKGKTSLA